MIILNNNPQFIILFLQVFNLQRMTIIFFRILSRRIDRIQRPIIQLLQLAHLSLIILHKSVGIFQMRAQMLRQFIFQLSYPLLSEDMRQSLMLLRFGNERQSEKR